MIEGKIFIFVSIILAFLGVSFFTTQKSIDNITNEKLSRVNLQTAYVKQKIVKEEKLSFLNSFGNNDYRITLFGKKYYFDKRNYLDWGGVQDLVLAGKKTLILSNYISSKNEYNILKTMEAPVHFYVTRNSNPAINSCNKGTFFPVFILRDIKNKLKAQRIDIFNLTDINGAPITLSQIKVQANLTPEEGKILTILLSKKECFFSNEGKGLEEYVFVSMNFVLNKLGQTSGAYLASKKIIDVKQNSINGALIGYLYPRSEIKDFFYSKKNGGLELCTVGYSVYNLCLVKN